MLFVGINYEQQEVGILIEQDTIKLLRECDAGIKMGVSAINEVTDNVSDARLRSRLVKCRSEHEKLEDRIRSRLDSFDDDGKEPNPIAKGMSWIKTNAMLAMDESDSTIADLLTDGCNMGVKSLSRYLNQYKAADEYSKDIAKRLIALEAELAEDMRGYL